jgi:hypothetical protein
MKCRQSGVKTIAPKCSQTFNIFGVTFDRNSASFIVHVTRKALSQMWIKIIYALVFSLFMLRLQLLAFPKEPTQKPTKKNQTEEVQPNIDGTVEVSFRIDATGKIQIVDLVSTNAQLSEYVIKKLAKIQVSDKAAEEGKVIKYRFTFKKQA